MTVSTPPGLTMSPPARHDEGCSDVCVDTPYTWNPNDPCFGWKRPCFGGLTFKNKGHWGSRYVCVYIYICVCVWIYLS